MMVMTMMVVMMMMIDDDDNYDEYDADFYCQVMVWSVGTGRPVRDIDAIRDIEYGSILLLLLLLLLLLRWASCHCTVQWSSLGSWGETADTPDPSTAAGECHIGILNASVVTVS